MRLRYENTMDDAIAFNDFHYAHSPTMKRAVRINKWGMGLMAFIFYSFVPGNKNTTINVTIAFVLACLFVLIYPSLVRYNIKRQVHKFYSEGNNKGFLGEHDIEIVEDGVIARSAYSETKTAWGAVERIETTPEHTFIYISAVTALIIPHDRITEGDYKAFLSELGQRFQPGQRLQSTSLS